MAGRPCGAPPPAAQDTAQAAVTFTLQVTVADARVVAPLLEEIERFAARVNTLSRAAAREPGQGPEVCVIPDSRLVLLNDAPIYLTRMEFDLLLYLCRNRARVISREELLTEVWGTTWAGASRTVDVHVRRLREKVGHELVRTVHSVGYTIADEAQVTVVGTQRSPGGRHV